MNRSFAKYPLTSSITGIPDLFVPNGVVLKKSKRRRKVMSLLADYEDPNSDTSRFHNPRKRIPARDQSGLVVVVRSADCQPLSLDQSGKTPSSLKGTLNFGSIASATNMSSPLQDFYCLSTSAHDQLCSAYPDGLELRGPDINAEIDAAVSPYAKANHPLLSLDKIVPPDAAGFHNFTRQFAGHGSPDVDNSFTSCHDVDGLIISYKVDEARAYSDFPPLSMGFFESTAHSVQIQQFYLPIINKALGLRGTYSKRACMEHKGSLSYLGPRKKGIMNRATISEGPKEPDIEQETKYCWHSKRVSHAYWPLVHSLVNNLLGAVCQVAYHVYPHLANFFPVSNDRHFRNKFCPRGIVAFQFSSSDHLDNHDNQRFCYEDMRSRLRAVIRRFGELEASGVKFVKARYREAVNALAHIEWWGVQLPTTCCYQYVQQEPVEVYQWFLCPGLGTTYRIRNYWVHLFLAGCFTHCTSAPIYVVGGRAYFGKCPKVVMFSWGGV